jgi:hypothetical protein
VDIKRKEEHRSAIGMRAEMRANANHDEPFWLLHPRFIARRIAQIAQGHRARGFDLFWGAMADENRLAAPFHGYAWRPMSSRRGLIWSISGQAAKPAAATPIAPVATNRKSLRVGSSATEALIEHASYFDAGAPV